MTTFFSITVVACQLLASVLVAHGQSPTLAETVDWLKGKADAVKSIDEPRQPMVLVGENAGHWELIYSGGCSLTLKNVPLKTYPEISVSFSLADLNPQKVAHTEMNEDLMDGGWLDLYATGGKNIFRWQITRQDQTYDSGGVFSGPQMKTKMTTTTPVDKHLRLAIRNSDLTRRMASAFQHAIALCGGKPDPKEPF